MAMPVGAQALEGQSVVSDAASPVSAGSGHVPATSPAVPGTDTPSGLVHESAIRSETAKVTSLTGIPDPAFAMSEADEKAARAIAATGEDATDADRWSERVETKDINATDAPTTPAAKQGDIEVTAPNGLAQAVTQATEMLRDGTKKTVTITVTTDAPQQLPPVIKANGTIVIVGRGDTPAGVGAKDGVARTKLTPATNAGGSKFESPVELRGVEATDIASTLIKAEDGLTIANSVFTGKAGMAAQALVVKQDLDDQHKSDVVVIKDSRITDARVIEVDDSHGKVTISRNVINHSPANGTETIEVDDDADYPANNPRPVVIEHNEFTSTQAGPSSAIVRISRPDVTVHANTFTLTNPQAGAVAVELINPTPRDGVALKNVAITFNRFDGGVAVANHKGTPIPAGAVRINDNDFSKAASVLPKDGIARTRTPKENIDATKNFWGNLKTDDVVAKTDTPLTQFTPPPASSPNPSNPTPPAPSPSPSSPSAPGTQTPSPSPSTGPAGSRSVRRVSGETRFETAVKVAQEEYKDGAKAVIVARGDIAADSVSAVPLAEAIDAPILLTQSDTLHPATQAEIKRLLPNGGKVVIMGGEAAVSKTVEQAITTLGGQVERLAGQNRAGTAVETANRLAGDNKLKELLVADGADWQPDLIAGPASAEVEGATLLTNGSQMAPETEAFIKQHANLKVTAIGTNAVQAGKNPAPTTGSGNDAPAIPADGMAPAGGTTGTTPSPSTSDTSQPGGTTTPSKPATPGGDTTAPNAGMTKAQTVSDAVYARAMAAQDTAAFADNATGTMDQATPSPTPTPQPSSTPTPSDGAGGIMPGDHSTTPGTTSPTPSPAAASGAITYQHSIEAPDPTALSVAVAKHFFKTPKDVGIATTEDFADALAGGAQIADEDGPMLLVPQQIPASVSDYVKGTNTITTIYVYGGPTRFSDDQLATLSQ
ncbi:cell wall-binding repeat-containing protein [Stomatohabitans albus]